MKQPGTGTSGGSSAVPGELGTRVTNEVIVAKFNQTSTSLSGTAEGLRISLKELEADLKKDKEGLKEYEDFLTTIGKKKAELQARIKANKAWVASFEEQKDNGGFEQQYKKLCGDISGIYENAKEFHGKGIDMLIKEFDYHITYKRWNDTFSAIPFTPK